MGSKFVGSYVTYELIAPISFQPKIHHEDCVPFEVKAEAMVIRHYTGIVEYDLANGETGVTQTHSDMFLNLFLNTDNDIEVWKEAEGTTKFPSRPIQFEAAKWFREQIALTNPSLAAMIIGQGEDV